jgi:hypothetical protein
LRLLQQWQGLLRLHRPWLLLLLLLLLLPVLLHMLLVGKALQTQTWRLLLWLN